MSSAQELESWGDASNSLEGHSQWDPFNETGAKVLRHIVIVMLRFSPLHCLANSSSNIMGFWRYFIFLQYPEGYFKQQNGLFDEVTNIVIPKPELQDKLTTMWAEKIVKSLLFTVLVFTLWGYGIWCVCMKNRLQCYAYREYHSMSLMNVVQGNHITTMGILWIFTSSCATVGERTLRWWVALFPKKKIQKDPLFESILDFSVF